LIQEQFIIFSENFNLEDFIFKLFFLFLGLPNTQVSSFCRNDSTEWQAVLQELAMSKVFLP